MSTVNFDNELSRRPDNSILTEAWERGTNLWSEELFRRMNHDEAKVDRVPLPPLPDTLRSGKKSNPVFCNPSKIAFTAICRLRPISWNCGCLPKNQMRSTVWQTVMNTA